VENGAYAIISDGCSSSPDVDVGSSLLALSAKRTLMIGGAEMNYDLFGKVTIRNLEHIGDTIPLDPQALDATLLAMWIKGKNFTAHMYGDGIFVHKAATTLRIVRVDFEPNGDNKPWPAYLSYYLDKLRLKEYEEKAVGTKHVLDVSLYLTPEGPPKDAIEVENYMNPFDAVTITGLADEGDILAISSDGINSFRKGDGSDIHWSKLAREFVDYKTTPGVFVQRRMSWLKRLWAKELISHYDDVSIAAIVV
jgi:hypothetical protein